MSLRAALAAALFLPAAPAPAAGPPPAVAEVAGLLPGTYVSRDPARSVRVVVVGVPKSRFAADAAVFYVEAAKASRPDAPYLQRFLRLQADGPGVAIRVYEPRDLAGVRGKWREPEALSLVTDRDVRERPDCRMALAKAPAGHWAGGTAAATCYSATANARVASRCPSRRRRWSGARREKTRPGRRSTAPRARSPSTGGRGRGRPRRPRAPPPPGAPTPRLLPVE